LLNNFIDIKSISNIGLFKCYKETLSKEGLKANISSYILIIIIILFFISFILFFSIEYKILFIRFEEVAKSTKNKKEVNNKDRKYNKNKKKTKFYLSLIIMKWICCI